MKLHTYHSLHMRNSCYNFGCSWSITKSSLLEEQSFFSTVLRLLFHGSFWNFTPITYYTCTINDMFGSNQSITNGTLLEEHSTFAPVSRLLSQGSFSSLSIIAIILPILMDWVEHNSSVVRRWYQCSSSLAQLMLWGISLVQLWPLFGLSWSSAPPVSSSLIHHTYLKQ